MYGSFLVVDIFKFIFLMNFYFFALPKTSLKMFQSSSWLKKPWSSLFWIVVWCRAGEMLNLNMTNFNDEHMRHTKLHMVNSFSLGEIYPLNQLF